MAGWLAGGTVALAIARRGSLKKLDRHLAGKAALPKSFIFGLGGLLGYLCLGYLLWADEINKKYATASDQDIKSRIS
ncbi:MAG: hypothetical protein V7696_00340 [Halioglobus sp.]